MSTECFNLYEYEKFTKIPKLVTLILMQHNTLAKDISRRKKEEFIWVSSSRGINSMVVEHRLWAHISSNKEDAGEQASKCSKPIHNDIPLQQVHTC